MDRNLLNRYFDKQCSDAEKEAVEEWLLDSNNQAEFERFLVSKWENYSDGHIRTNVLSLRKSKASWLKAAAVILLLGVGGYLYYAHVMSSKDPSKTLVIQEDQQTMPVQNISPSEDTLQLSSNPINTIRHEQKKKKIHSAQNVALVTDSMGPRDKVKSVQASRLGNFKVNEVLLSQLRGKIDSNQLFLNIDVHEATFAEIAFRLKKNYGIILEACDTTGNSKTYSAKFEKISFPDLLNDMSEKMLFSYSVNKDTVKICFN